MWFEFLCVSIFHITWKKEMRRANLFLKQDWKLSCCCKSSIWKQGDLLNMTHGYSYLHSLKKCPCSCHISACKPSNWGRVTCMARCSLDADCKCHLQGLRCAFLAGNCTFTVTPQTFAEPVKICFHTSLGSWAQWNCQLTVVKWNNELWTEFLGQLCCGPSAKKSILSPNWLLCSPNFV